MSVHPLSNSIRIMLIKSGESTLKGGKSEGNTFSYFGYRLV